MKKCKIRYIWSKMRGKGFPPAFWASQKLGGKSVSTAFALQSSTHIENIEVKDEGEGIRTLVGTKPIGVFD